MTSKKQHPMNRDQWIVQMYDFGKKGIKDFGHLHKKVIPASKYLIRHTRDGPILKKLDPHLDVHGFDMPRKDIEKVKIKNGKIIRVGSDNISKDGDYFRNYIVPLIRPKRKKFSAPTASRISMLAPSSVPMVSAPLSANFMLPVPEASMPAVEICSERSAAGMIRSALVTL